MNILAMILAGGEGRRLFPLTDDRAKPAVPFGGKYRIIDFVLNNFINSGIYKIKILTQFKSDSLNKHISRGWPMAPVYGHFVDLVPAQMRTGQTWYQGTADAIYQNLNIIDDEQPEQVCVFSGDHVYKMDIRQMLTAHQQAQADLTIAAMPVPSSDASAFGVMQVDENWRLIGWAEKPEEPAEIPGRPGWSLVSMGNYVFNTAILTEALRQDAEDLSSSHDFGKNIIARLLQTAHVQVYDFTTNVLPGNILSGALSEQAPYWRDVGTLDAYWEAHMDLVSAAPNFDLYNPHWPLRTYLPDAPPAKFVHDVGDRRGYATDSIVSDGCIISGGRLNRCVLFPFVRINSYSVVEESILMQGVSIGRHAQVRRAIIDKHVQIPAGMTIGFNREEDEALGLTVSPGGVTVVPKGTRF